MVLFNIIKYMGGSKRKKSPKDSSKIKLHIKIDNSDIDSTDSPTCITHFFDNVDLSESSKHFEVCGPEPQTSGATAPDMGRQELRSDQLHLAKLRCEAGETKFLRSFKHYVPVEANIPDCEIEESIDNSLLIKIFKKKLDIKKKKLKDDEKKWDDIKKDRQISSKTRKLLDDDFRKSQRNILKDKVKTNGNYNLCNTISKEADYYYDCETNCLDVHKLYVQLIQLERQIITNLQNNIKKLDRERYNIIKDNMLLKKLHNL